MVGGEKKERSQSEPPMDGWSLHHRVAKQLLTSIITSPPQKSSENPFSSIDPNSTKFRYLENKV